MGARPSQFDISPSSGAPIYRQIIDQVHALIAGGRLLPGELLPSVREVARNADVNPMTVSKAYSRLEADGVVERVRGQGMRVREVTAVGDTASRQQQFQRLVQPALHRAYQLGLTEAEIRQVVDQLINQYQAPASSVAVSNATDGASGASP